MKFFEGFCQILLMSCQRLINIYLGLRSSINTTEYRRMKATKKSPRRTSHLILKPMPREAPTLTWATLPNPTRKRNEDGGAMTHGPVDGYCRKKQNFSNVSENAGNVLPLVELTMRMMSRGYPINTMVWLNRTLQSISFSASPPRSILQPPPCYPPRRPKMHTNK